MRRTLLTLTIGLTFLATTGTASAAPFTVDDLDDASDAGIDGVCDATGADTCTLRAALNEANATVAADTVTIAAPGTIDLDFGALAISQEATVTGDPAGTTIDAQEASRVLSTAGPPITLNDLTLQDGSTVGGNGAGIFHNGDTLTLNGVTVTSNSLASGGGDAGGGIATTAGADLILNDSTVSDNTITGTSGLGGGIAAQGVLTIDQSTISGNKTTTDAGARGGGIDASPSGPVTVSITNSTISGNDTGDGGGGGVFVNSLGTAQIVGSTIAGNTSNGGPGGGVDVNGPPATSKNTIYASNTGGSECFFLNTPAVASSNIDSGDHCGFGSGAANQENISGAALGLGALAPNGGPTLTRSISPTSAALDAAVACEALTEDQRGVSRPQGASCDIGAFELEYRALTVSVTGSGTVAGDGISCPGDCSTSVPTSVQVSLTATPSSGFSFGGWSGDCSGTGDCTVALHADRAVTATFAAIPPPPGGGETPTPPAPKKCKKGQKLKKGKCVKKKRKKKR
jgi:hypothetical protein